MQKQLATILSLLSLVTSQCQPQLDQTTCTSQPQCIYNALTKTCIDYTPANVNGLCMAYSHYCYQLQSVGVCRIQGNSCVVYDVSRAKVAFGFNGAARQGVIIRNPEQKIGNPNPINANPGYNPISTYPYVPTPVAPQQPRPHNPPSQVPQQGYPTQPINIVPNPPSVYNPPSQPQPQQPIYTPSPTTFPPSNPPSVYPVPPQPQPINIPLPAPQPPSERPIVILKPNYPTPTPPQTQPSPQPPTYKQPPVVPYPPQPSPPQVSPQPPIYPNQPPAQPPSSPPQQEPCGKQ